MADGDLLASAATHGGAFVGGGTLLAGVLRFMFGDVAKRLDKLEHEQSEALKKIAEQLEKLVNKSDERHEKLIERLSQVEGKADAAHRRLDELRARRGR